jgi:hypothetical protein
MKKFTVYATAILVFMITALFLASGCSKKIIPTQPPDSTKTFTATITATPVISATASPTASPTLTATATDTDTPQDTATDTPMDTATFTRTVTCTDTAIPPATDTATATATTTPAYGTITGNLVLASAQGGYTYEVLVDTDLNFSNGIINLAVGTCPAALNVPYSVTVPAGTYYVYAMIKTASAPQYPPAAGDYLGTFGATYPAFPASANVSAALGAVTSGIDIDMVLAPGNLHGTLIMPANADGKNMLIALDDDGNVANGGISVLDLITISGMAGNTYVYDILCPFPGTYYIFAMVDNDATGLPGAPTTGDYLSFVPSGPHVIDPSISNGPFNVTLTAFP